MALADIINKIISDAEASAKEVSASADAAVSEIRSRTKRAIVEYERRQTKVLEAELKHRRKTALSRASRKAGLILSRARRQAVEKVLSEVEREIVDNEKFYLDFLRLATASLGKDFRPSSEKAVWYLPAAVGEMTRRFLEENNLASDEDEFVEDGNIKAGFKVDLPRVSYNLTLERFLADRRDELEPFVLKEFSFSDG